MYAYVYVLRSKSDKNVAQTTSPENQEFISLTSKSSRTPFYSENLNLKEVTIWEKLRADGFFALMKRTAEARHAAFRV